MAKSRDLKRRIKSVKNTAKITHTMELVATAKARLATNRIQRAVPYFQALAQIAGEARKAAVETKKASPAERARPDEPTDSLHPLLVQREVKKVTILAIAANRGLCGGYNGNVLRMLRRRRDELAGQGIEVTILAVGKKLVNGLRYQQIPHEVVAGPVPDDRPPFSDCERIADDLARRFIDGLADRVEVVYTHYVSASNYHPVVETVLPIESADEESEEAAQARLAKGKNVPPQQTEKPKASVDFIIEPDPRTILDALFPLQAKLHIYRVFLETATAEQIARRGAMKSASDNADEVGKSLRMQYNRARQAGITKEILEIVGGAEALA